MTDEQFESLGPLAREIVEIDRDIAALNGFVVSLDDARRIRDLRSRRADLRRQADAIWGVSAGKDRPLNLSR